MSVMPLSVHRQAGITALATSGTKRLSRTTRTGYTVSGITAGRIQNQMVREVQRRLAAQAGQGARGGPRNGGEALIPVYDGSGNVVAYERSVVPDMQEVRAPNGSNTEQVNIQLNAWAGMCDK